MNSATADPEIERSLELLNDTSVAPTQTNLSREQKSSASYLAKYIGVPATVAGIFVSHAFVDSGVANKAPFPDRNLYQYNVIDHVGDNLFGYSYPDLSMGAQSFEEDYISQLPFVTIEDIRESEAFIDSLHFLANMDVIEDEDGIYGVDAEIEVLDDQDEILFAFDDEDKFFF
ncbi:hypothetical protein [Neobacillus sp. OS1-33]|uniref:hypothetical protein n=1 Tax=Neobacillus sp. OS1-33 TaxID=3070683 RepID=UPI0027DF8ACF|nr:hypothetical protein [Neobacillus sp. OS1-33]WML24111.1 hypothetical protein RCG22_14210 [Neobacillus sp. OS1-33]